MIISFQLLLLSVGSISIIRAGRHVYQDSFETFAEYDPSILDPHHVYGSPYGGFSRDVRNRLAQLPLPLPETSEEFPSDDPLYQQVRDSSGRLFSCRVYHEDELEPSSLEESMFDAPRLRAPSDETPSKVQERKLNKPVPKETVKTFSHVPSASEPGLTSASAGAVPAHSTEETKTSGSRSKSSSDVKGTKTSTSNTPSSNSKENADGKDDSAMDSGMDKDSVQATLEHALALEERLQQLQGICGQIHKGYWSYEWCFQQSNTQFHIEYDQKKNQVSVEGVTQLGRYNHRTINLDLKGKPPNELAEDTPELARVVDFHENGGICPDTKKPRKTFVNLRCCSEKIMQRKSGMIHKDGHQIASDLAAVVDVFEDPNEVCVYNITVCTPLLCGEQDELDKNLSPSKDTKDLRTLIEQFALSSTVDSSVNENESIREILDRILTNLCLQSNTGGWWTYEFCHKQSVRQFHEVPGVRRNSAGQAVTSNIIESEHKLGFYDEDIAMEIPDEEEWKLVVNATSDGKSWGDGNGAYYEVEYINGDHCDHPDVTDSAIVAGSTSSHGVERASTVRFYCGQHFDVQVNEDSTCHYIVDVKVPELCRHPLFRAPISKKQVMKCLPVD